MNIPQTRDLLDVTHRAVTVHVERLVALEGWILTEVATDGGHGPSSPTRPSASRATSHAARSFRRPSRARPGSAVGPAAGAPPGP